MSRRKRITYNLMAEDKRNERASWLSMWSSQVGKKILTGFTGLGLTLFVLMHMSGNLTYFSGNDDYNAYAQLLTDLGPLFYAIEFGLSAFFIFHIMLGINLAIGNRKARRVSYRFYQSVGGPSKRSISSRSMIFTGLILLVFLVVHLKTFKYGTYYETTVNGEPMRDLARLVTEKFESPFYAFGYVTVMAILAVHLRHGVWSAFQSLGTMNARLTPVIYVMGVLLAVLIAVGFVILPLWIFFTGGN